MQAVSGRTSWVLGAGDINIEILLNGLKECFISCCSFQIWKRICSQFHQFCRDVETLHTKTGCTMLVDGIVVMTGDLSGMVYKLHIRAIAPPATECLINHLGLASAAEGTKSLSSPSFHNYHSGPTMAASETVNGLRLPDHNSKIFCAGSPVGKSHRHSFPLHPIRERAQLPDICIHADICGLLPVPSLGGAVFIC